MKFTVEIGAMVMPYCRNMEELKDYVQNSGYKFLRYINEDTMQFVGLNEELVITQQGNYFIDIDIEIPEKFAEDDKYINNELYKYVSNLKEFILGLDRILHSRMIEDEIRVFWKERKRVLGEKYPYTTKFKL